MRSRPTITRFHRNNAGVQCDVGELDRNSFHPADVNYRQTMCSAQFSQHAMHVVTDCLLSKAQLGRDLLICKPTRNQADELLFPVCQSEFAFHMEVGHLILPRRVAEQKGTQFRRANRTTVCHCAHRSYDLER